MIPIYKPYLNNEILKYAHDALDSGWISSIGKYKELASELLCESTGTKYSYLTCNGTVSCHLVSKVLQQFYPKKKKVIVPSNCYVAAWNGLLFDNPNSFDIIPVDADPDTWNMNLEGVSGDVFYIVHNLGNVINVPKLKRKYPDAVFVEDACEALFGTYENNLVGSASLCSAFSFFGNKNISAGEGGAVVTNDSAVFEYVKHISEQAQTMDRFVHDGLGYNYRMSNVHAALLYGQLKHADEIMEHKQRVFDLYDFELNGLNVKSQKREDDTNHACWLYGIKFENAEVKTRVETYLKSSGVDTRPMFYPINKHDHLVGFDNYEVSACLSETSLLLPSYPELTKRDISGIVNLIKNLGDVNVYY